ncbi:hypothetical protein RF11_02719 [Thelohanellus kitauei]|uniref:Uncharacterized protein n=1 Tax=Thelohanellus kitauei TaxID=669202 RepID=A0A0C2IIX7_THEKT|nr:hypothetical protein RF11_02719 [Thelohanellus kitauei]
MGDFFKISIDEDPQPQVDTFNLLCESNKWTFADRIINLKLALQANLRLDVQNEFGQLRSLARKKREVDEHEHEFNLFLSASSTILSREFNRADPLDLFMRCQISAGERPAKFLRRLETLIKKVMPDLCPSERDILLRKRFLANLPTPINIRRWLQAIFP